MDDILKGLLSGYFQHQAEMREIQRETDMNNAMADAFMAAAQQLRDARTGVHQAQPTVSQPLQSTEPKLNGAQSGVSSADKTAAPSLPFPARPLPSQPAQKRSQPQSLTGEPSAALLATSRYLQQFVNSYQAPTPLASQNAAGVDTPPLASRPMSIASSPQVDSSNPSPTLGVVLERFRQRKQLLQQQQQPKQEDPEMKESSRQNDQNDDNTSTSPPRPPARMSGANPVAKTDSSEPFATKTSLTRQITLPPGTSTYSTEKSAMEGERLALLGGTDGESPATSVPRSSDGGNRELSTTTSVAQAAITTSSTPPEVREEFEALFGKKTSPTTAISSEGNKTRNGAGNIVAVVGRKKIGEKEKHPKALLGGGLGACAALKRAREDAEDNGQDVEGGEDGKKSRGRPKSKKPQVECTPAEYWEIQ